MPPPLLRLLSGLAIRSADPANVQPYFSAERKSWLSPDDTLSILMIIGGDIVQRAVAQLAGSGPLTPYWHFAPVAFSFGWLAYSVSALTSAVGDGRLMPQPDCGIQVVNAKSGYGRQNASWVLGRLVRDREKHKFGVHPQAGSDHQKSKPADKSQPARDEKSKKKGSSLTVVFYRTVSGKDAPQAGVPARDWVYWSGVAVILFQLAISVIPGALRGNWVVLMVTVGGTVLALLGSGLPQWREEKYAARKIEKGSEVVCLTRGNGSTFAMVVISETGIRLEDLAGGRDKRQWTTSVMSALLSILWIVLLLTVEGLDGDAWYLLAVGGLGMVQNVVAAGAQRSASALGFHFEPLDERRDVVRGDKVMKTLKEAEKRQPGVGLAMLKIFFPGELRPEEQQYWDKKRVEKAAMDMAANGNNVPPTSEPERGSQVLGASSEHAETLAASSLDISGGSLQTQPSSPSASTALLYDPNANS
ncbi:hypothetical protein GY45DRAFT_1331093 [Cubamyces sp. BRFM 1775]|nr:hypothetical protein GY45DRAFT_1331093 [Cubamyces sp. BRFM 1775]